ncbi:Uncharacterised protein [Burkholderia pseudomallei]|nr:Uncharacterised protein [Burkholderia pseudomallei]
MRRCVRQMVAATVQQIAQIVGRAGNECGLRARIPEMLADSAVQRRDVRRDRDARRRSRQLEDRPLDAPAGQRDRAVDLTAREARPLHAGALRLPEQACTLSDAQARRVVARALDVGRMRREPIANRRPHRNVEPQFLDLHERGIALLFRLQVVAAIDEQNELRNADPPRGGGAQEHARAHRSVESGQRIAWIIAAWQPFRDVLVLRRDDKRVELQRVDQARKARVRIDNRCVISREVGETVFQTVDHRMSTTIDINECTHPLASGYRKNYLSTEIPSSLNFCST